MGNRSVSVKRNWRKVSSKSKFVGGKRSGKFRSIEHEIIKGMYDEDRGRLEF